MLRGATRPDGHAPTAPRCQHAAIVSCHEPKVRDAPWIVDCSLEFGMEAEGRYAPRPLHGPNIWQAFDATSRRCVEHTGLEACRCARRPGWLNAAWSFEWKLRGATRPDCHKVLAFGVRFMPRDIQFRFFFRLKFEL